MKKKVIMPGIVPEPVRKMFFAALLIVAGRAGIAQDNIFLKNGNEIKARIIEITDETIRYTNYSEPNGVQRTLLKTEVFMVRYENGVKEVFKPSSAPAARVVYAQPVVDPGFDPDTSDFARIRRKKFSGPRVGVTFVSPGTSADYLSSIGKRPIVTQFGWQFEARLFTVEETSGIVEFVPMIGGVEQGLFIPSASVLLGIRSGSKYVIEFAIGPNFSVVPDYFGRKKGFAGLVLAAGTSLRKGNVYFPITVAFVPSVGNVQDVYDAASQTSSKVKYYSGSRLSVLVGFNSRKK